MQQPVKACLFEKIIFSARLSLNQFILAFSYGFKITCILLRQVISFKKMMILSAKFTILIPWSPICIPLILLSALAKLASTSTAILYKIIKSRHPWRTHTKVKGSDMRRFMLILDSMLIYVTQNMWMNLSPYPNLCNAEKIKATVRILEKDFYSVYLTHQL